MDCRRPPQPVLGVFLMRKTLLAGVAVLCLTVGTARAVEMEGFFKLQESYWATQAAEKELQEAEKEVRGGCMFICTPDEQKNWKALWDFFALLDRHWVTGAEKKSSSWNGVWPKHTTVRPPSNSFTPIPPIVLLRENGGIIVDHVKRWIELAASNKDVEIRGPCYSACTLIMAYVPKEQICFDRAASLNFHQTRLIDGRPSPEYTEWMFNRYPPDIRAWLNKRGGPEKLPTSASGEFWVLWANNLWDMGYRRCEPYSAIRD